MLAYSATKARFLKDAPEIDDIILASVKTNLNLSPSPAEIAAWRNSLGNAMANIMNLSTLPDDVGVAIEYRLNSSRHRIDFLISGLDEQGNEKLLIIELKQWTEMEFSELADHVMTFVGGAVRNERHPSYQAWSYSNLLHQFNEYIYEKSVGLVSCAYLHNCKVESVVRDSRYENYLRDTPVYLKGEHQDLGDFLERHIKKGVGTQIIERVEASPIRPSKQLADSVGSMLDGNEEFVLVDDQKTVLEKIKTAALVKAKKKKQVIIVNGGPGTGKSVISLHALAELTALRKNARYVTPNEAPRKVFQSKLAGKFSGEELKSFFSGSSSFTESNHHDFDCLIVDEAHRLKKKSQYRPSKENQIVDVINASRTTVFFIDQAQKVTWADIGEIDEIRKAAKRAGAEIEELELVSQFRCGGSDDYMAWIDNLLQIHEKVDSYFTTKNFDFRIFDDPNSLFEAIREKNAGKNKSRMVAGYCWDWASAKDSAAFDIRIGTDFKARWNLKTYNDAWLINTNSINEVGCIHTVQGLELEYVGVIVGTDLTFEDGKLTTHPEKRAKTDKSLNGFKKAYKEDPERAMAKADEIIRNTYRTLMTRGMKGCFVYFMDSGLRDYFKSQLPS